MIFLEVRAGIEPAYADLQSAASPLCHRTQGNRPWATNRRNLPLASPARGISECFGLIQKRTVARHGNRLKAIALARLPVLQPAVQFGRTGQIGERDRRAVIQRQRAAARTRGCCRL